MWGACYCSAALAKRCQVVPRRANSQLHCFSEDYEAVAYSTYGDAAWAYVKERTGTELFGILTQLAAERSGRHE